MKQPILVIAELLDGEARKATAIAAGCAQGLAKSGASFDILCIGEKSEQVAPSLQGWGAGKVLCAEIAGGYVCERYLPTVAEVVQSGGYKVVIATATTYGKDLGGRLAARLRAGLAADVTAVAVEGEALVYTRPMYAGNLFGTLSLSSEVEVVTLRQTEFEAASSVDAVSAVETVAVVEAPLAERIEFLGLEQVESDRPELTDADVVIAGGRALKSADGFKELLEPLADKLGAAIGASRAACDAGYATVDMQVGQTGKVVAPKLYIAVGISGAIQHLAGMKGSKVIVAINKDKEAPITQVADYVLAEDLFTVVPELTQALAGVKAG